MEQAANAQVQNCNINSTSPRTLHRSNHIVSDKTKENPKVGDIWIPHSRRYFDHFTRFFIPEIEVLFQAGDKVLKVEASSLSSRLVCWKLW
jgi:hypothetical protein